MSRSQSRTNARLEILREERRVLLQELAWEGEERRNDIIWDAYDAGLVTDAELDFEEDIYLGRKRRTRDFAARSRARMTPFLCSVCGDPVYAKGRCRSCYVFLRKHKRDRTHDEIVENTARAARRAH